MGSVLSAASLKQLLRRDPPLVEGLLDEELQVQPNGIDLSLQSVQTFDNAGQLGFSSSDRVLPGMMDLAFVGDRIHLTAGSYLVTFNEIVHLPLNLMALGRPRSSLLRMAVNVGTAVWDAGYHGRSQSLLVVHHPQGVSLTRNARLIQLVFIALDDTTHGYTGIYQNENMPVEK
jgi:dUTP pyrophosphatase